MDDLHTADIPSGTKGFIYESTGEMEDIGAWVDVDGFVPRDGYAEQIRQPYILSTNNVYNTGTVTVTNGSSTVTGAGGAAFPSYLVGGKFVSTDGLTYSITGWTNSTTLTISPVYGGATLSGQSYTITYFNKDYSSPANTMIPAKIHINELTNVKEIWIASDYQMLKSTNEGVNFVSAEIGNGYIQSSGTVSVTNGSTAVVGTGTSFNATLLLGRFNVRDSVNGGVLGSNYVIAAVTDATHLTLGSSYTGTTNAAATYIAMPAISTSVGVNRIPRMTMTSFIGTSAGSTNDVYGTDYNGYIWNFSKSTRVTGFDPLFTNIVVSFKGFLLACGTSTTRIQENPASITNPMTIQWSVLGDATTWTGGLSGNVTLNQGGTIILAAKVLGDSLIIYTDSAIYKMDYIGQPYVWSIERIANIGLIDFDNVYVYEKLHFFIGQNGIYLYDGRNEPKHIGREITKYFFSLQQFQHVNVFSSGISYDSEKKIVWVYFNRTDGITLTRIFDAAILINIETEGIGFVTFKKPFTTNIIFHKNLSYGSVLLGARAADYIIIFDPFYKFNVPFADSQVAHFVTRSTSGMPQQGKLVMRPDRVKSLGRCEISGRIDVDTNSTLIGFRPVIGDTAELLGVLPTKLYVSIPIPSAQSTYNSDFTVSMDFNLAYKYFGYLLETDNVAATYNPQSKVKIAMIRPFMRLRGKI